jgi:predicted MPP superfamily phosphohydrolase
MSKLRSQRRMFGQFVLLLFAVMVACQVPIVFFVRAQTQTSWALWLPVLCVFNLMLCIRMWYVPRPEPPPIWFERYIIWGYFGIAVTGLYAAPGVVIGWAWTIAPIWIWVWLGCSAVLGLYSVGFPWRRIAIRRLTVPIPDLPAAFDGVTIAHISDLHAGPMAPECRLRSWMRRVNALAPDYVFITGDIVATGGAFIPTLERAFALLKPSRGMYAVLGNHDYFGEAQSQIEAMYARIGCTLLRNSHCVVSVPSSQDTLVFAGVDDTWREMADLSAALSGVPTGAPVILLSHDPRVFDEVVAHEESSVRLQLSGHTHGGQLAIPFVGRRSSVLSWFGVSWVSGLYQRSESWLHVSAGLGTTGAPVRIGVPSEITLLRLQRSPNRAHPSQ